MHNIERFAFFAGQHIVVIWEIIAPLERVFYHSCRYGCFIDIAVGAAIRNHRQELDGLGIRIVGFPGTLDLKVVSADQILSLRVANRPTQCFRSGVTALRIFALFDRKIVDAVVGRYVYCVRRALNGSGYIRVGLHRKRSPEATLDIIACGHDDRTGTIAYRHRLRAERGRIGFGILVDHVRYSGFAVADRIAIVVHKIQIGRLQLRCYQVICTVHTVGEAIPEFLVGRFRLILCIVFVDIGIYAGIERCACQRLRQIPVELEEHDAFVAAVHRFLCRQFDTLIPCTGINLLRSAVCGLRHFDCTILDFDLCRAVFIRIRRVLRVRTTDIHKMCYVGLICLRVMTRKPECRAGTETIVVLPAVRPDRNLEMDNAVTFGCNTVVFGFFQEIIRSCCTACE